MKTHIRVITPVIPTGLTQASDFEGILGPGDHLSYVEIARGPASIECGFDKMLAAPETVACMIEAERDGVDAVVIDCMEDPGLWAGRECLSIPVLGPCQTTMNLASTLGHRFTVLSVTPNMRVHFETQARVYGAGDKYASTRSVDIPVLELKSGSAMLKERLLEQAIAAIEQDGADTLILGCTGMVGVARGLQDDLAHAGWSVPVLDPVPVTVRVAKVFVDSGISHSKRAYPTPGRKVIHGFEGSALETFRDT